MDTQLSLFAQEPPSSLGRNSLFVACIPDEFAKLRILEHRARLEEQYGYLGKTVDRELLHMTLGWVGTYAGDIPPRVLRDALEACAAAAKFPSFRIQLDHVETFGKKSDNRPLVMTMGNAINPLLMEFQQSLMKQLWLHGLPCKDNPKFHPHVTLSRGSLEIAKPTVGLSWIAGEIVLLQSIIGQGRHVPLGNWLLDVA
jgi:2'-5' RNA ligase